jgi:4-aminobutyrate aminotransferase-like enzyme
MVMTRRSTYKKEIDGVLNYRSNPFVHSFDVSYEDEKQLLVQALKPRGLAPDKTALQLMRDITNIKQANWLAITLCGSDANNLIFDVLNQRDPQKFRVIVFDHMWLAQRGPLFTASAEQVNYCKKLPLDPRISIVNAPYNRTDGTSEILKNSYDCSTEEVTVLDHIESLLKNHNVGALICEVMTCCGMYILSGSFLRAVCALCHTYSVLVLVDEIMTFGITRQPFLWQHVQGFLPDIVSVGKAFGVCGLINTRGKIKLKTHSSFALTSPITHVCLWYPTLW